MSLNAFLPIGASFLAGILAASPVYLRRIRGLRMSRELLSNAIRRQNQSESDLPPRLRIGTELTTHADEAGKTARAVGELVRAQSMPEAAAVAVVVRASRSVDPKLEYADGIPARRMSEGLISFFEALQDGEDGALRWGPFVPERGTLHDFSIFGIGSVLSVPISSSAGVRGMIWLGFGLHCATLPLEKLRFLNDVCEYCSAAFDTAEKVQERLARRELQRDVLLGMSHDLRAPGNSALYALRDLLSESAGELSTDQRIRLRIVEECLEDQLDMLSDVIDYTRNQRGLLNPTREQVLLRESLPRILDLFRPQIEQHGLSFDIQSVPDAAVLVDPRHFKRVVSNLLSNAIKYTDRGFVRVEVTASNDFVLLSFTDSGRGIPEGERAHLFREFSRLSSSSGKHGSGLGLVIARELVRANGGELRYEPGSNGGSVFHVELLRAAEQRRPADAIPIVSRILIVDDDAAACRTNQRFLSGFAKEIFTATNSADALRVLAAEKPDVLVSDLHLGTSTAEPLFRYLRDSRQKTATIILSGSPGRSTLNQFEPDLPIRYLTKPAGREALQDAVRKAVASAFSVL